MERVKEVYQELGKLNNSVQLLKHCMFSPLCIVNKKSKHHGYPPS